ncbi:hypothetical protein [uncultured Roseobacter sp.]|uniref:hypothetical protein n=1 Tax=uncultured Roseobacter sp. TaxID=114847 RepID=UPI002617BF9E|nr:hypothetical protein [uncultured Roseobacter sp.]
MKDNEEDWRENPAIVALIEAALLSVIRTHDRIDGKVGEGEIKRLQDAKAALFGFEKKRGRRKDRDMPELIYMAQIYVRERGSYALDSDFVPIFSKNDEEEQGYQTELARRAIEYRKACNPSYRPHNEAEKLRNLQQKFDESRKDLIRLVVGWGGTRGGLIATHVRDLSDTLQLLGIPVQSNTDQDRDLNSPN